MTGIAHRLFVAIELPGPTRRSIETLLASSRAAADDAVRWTPSEQLHLTVRFFGDVEVELIPLLAAALRDSVAPVPAFDLGFGAPGAFPGTRRPRTLWLGIAPALELLELRAAVERSVGSIGLSADTRPFRPHVTLGRVGRSGGPAVRWPDPAAGAPLPDPFRVESIALIRSVLGRRGAVHTPVERFPLRCG